MVKTFNLFLKIGLVVLMVFLVTKFTASRIHYHNTKQYNGTPITMEERDRQLTCLAKNIYHEARNEGMTGQRAVAWATLNRVHSDKYPDTVCEVVYQAVLNEDGIPLRNECQFSWFCDGKSDEIENQAAWNVAEQIAVEVTNSYGKETDPTNGAFMYHAYYVEPYWATSYEKTARIDSHIFYN